MTTIKLLNSNDLGLIDQDDLIKCLDLTWRLQTNGYIVSSACKKHKLIYLHKFILGVHSNKYIYVDHIDRNKLNCTRQNLRICNQAQNAVNRLKYKGNFTSQYKGVSFHKASNKWQATITVNNKQISGGVFNLESEAALKVNELYLKYFGEFAILNVIK